MEFYSRASGKFFTQMIFSLIALSTTFVIGSIVKINHQYYLLALWLFFAVIIWIQFARYLLIVINNKPLLIVNEAFVFDRIYNIKYLWSDVKEIVLNGSTLDVILYNPDIYLDQIKNPLRRAYCRAYYNFTKSTPFKIKISFINVNKNVLLELLTNYSLESEKT